MINIIISAIFSFIVLILTFLYWRFHKGLEYFNKNDIHYLKPTFLIGNIGEVLWEKKPLPVLHMELYKKLAPHKYVGYFQFSRHFFMIRDPELIRHVLVKDFTYFQDRAIPINPKVDRISNNLLTMKGDEWKNHRIKLTSTFTSGKMKIMFPLVKECGDKCAKVLETLADSAEPFNVKELCSRYTCDVIGTCAFGIETHSLDDPNSEFLKMGNRVFEFRYRNLIAGAFPKMPAPIARFFNLRFVDLAVQNFFVSIIENTVKYREENKVTRYDFIDLLLSLKNETMGKYHDQHEQEEVDRLLSQIGDKNSKNKIDMTIETMAAQCFIFFGAGFETSSTALGFLMLELALHQDIQDKVRNEVNTVIANNAEGFTYEILREMNYVDMVISELLRKYPATGFILRECTQDYTIPNTNVVIPKNTPLTVPVYGLHTDPKYYEKPDQFYPEHFTKEAIAKRPHYTYLPFGEGPRGCIGEKWKNLRVKLTSAFTSGKMKMMFPLVKTCGDKLAQVLETMTKDEEPIDVKDLFARFTTDVIGTCAFGIETHSLDDPDSEFRKMGNRIFEFRYKALILGAIPNIPPQLVKLLNLRLMDQDLEEFFMSIIENTVKYREDNKVSRHDFIDLLLSLKNETMSKYKDHQEQEDLDQFLSQVGSNQAKGKIEMTVDLMAAQCFIFFGAGFETSSNALGFLMLELAMHPEIQNKLREEINTVINNNPEGLTYDLLREMPYIDLVIAEGLRKYPATGFVVRQCAEDYKLPNTNVIIPKDMLVAIPIFGLHRDPKYYEKPEEFYPEHFTKEAIARRPNYTYLPFGDGPRACIGKRFAEMQVKVGLISMLRNFRFELSPKTILPVEFERHFILLKSKGGIWLRCERI